MSDYHQVGDPFHDDAFEKGQRSVSVYEGQQIARRIQAEVLYSDRALSPVAKGVLEHLGLRSPTRRAIRELEERGELAALLRRLIELKADILISLEHLYRASELGAVQAEADVEVERARAERARRQRDADARTLRNAQELESFDQEIAIKRRQNELLRLEAEAEKIKSPPPKPQPITVVKPPPPVSPPPPKTIKVPHELKVLAERADTLDKIKTYGRMLIAQAEQKRELGLLSPEEFEDEITEIQEGVDYACAEFIGRQQSG